MNNLPEHSEEKQEEVQEQQGEIVVEKEVESTAKSGFSYEIENSKSSIAEFKTLFNSIVKTIESDEDVLIAFELNIQENINISQSKSTVSYMKTLVTTMLKLIEKDDTGHDVSYKLHIQSK